METWNSAAAITRGAVGKTYTLVAAVDVHADDAADRGTGDLLSPTCGSALADKVQPP